MQLIFSVSKRGFTMLVNNIMRKRRSSEGKKELHTKVFLLKYTHNAHNIL